MDKSTSMENEKSNIAQIESSESLSNQDRLIEASLFIDQKFINVAVITGNTKNPELMFGETPWLDYMDARKASKNYGKNELTTDFILELHKFLTRRSNPEVSGKIRDFVVIAADYNNPEKPVSYTKEQAQIIQANPNLSFRKTEESETTGFIVYPKPEDVQGRLKELCEWFNQVKKQEQYDPFKVAALLQRKLVSIHPFNDANGTLSRLLMNWSLENDGESASILSNPNEDILTSENEWVEEVKKGSKKLRDIRLKELSMKNAGIEDMAGLFGLEQEQAFYDYVFKHIKNAPLFVFKDGKLDHMEYEAFVESFTKEFKLFESLIKINTTINTGNSARMLSQGGLISEEFIKLASIDYSNLTPEGGEFFSDVDVYRGGQCEDLLSDSKVCELFVNYVGVGAGYRAVDKSGITATSGQMVDSGKIKEAMQYYNKMLAAFFFKEKHSETENPYSHDPNVKDLKKTIAGHVAGGESVWSSPFASTSLDESVSMTWAMPRTLRNGVLFKAKAPKEGLILSFGKALVNVNNPFQFEREALIAGGLQPSSIWEVQIFDKSVRHGVDPAVIARRTQRQGINGIELEDRKGQFVVKRFYAYNVHFRSFELVSEEQTQIPVTPIKIPTREPAIADLLHDLLSNQEKIGTHIPEIKLDIFSKDIKENVIVDYLKSNFEKKFENNIKEKPYNNFDKLKISDIYKPLKEIKIEPKKSKKKYF